MAKLEDKSKKQKKGNSIDTLLPLYILKILKDNSSPNNPITAKQTYDYLIKEERIDSLEVEESQIRKIRRHLDTLAISYAEGCIKKEEGRSKREGDKWYYDANLDTFANESSVAQETLSDVELQFLVELVSATKILNSDSTLGMVDKLLKKTSLSYEERVKKLQSLKKEGWLKSPNDDLVQKKDLIESIGKVLVEFTYEGNTIIATPIDWIDKNGVCYLKAKVNDKSRLFALDKIRDYEESLDNDKYDDSSYFSESSVSNKTALDSLFANIPTLNDAIDQKKEVSFVYLSYVVRNNKVELQEHYKNVLPHSLVFKDGKYYLICIDEDAPERNKIAYFRVDLMMDLEFSNRKIKLSDWNKEIFEGIDRVSEIEKHPLMIAAKDIPVKFLVTESALDKVIDAFGLDIKEFTVTEQTKVEFTVRTSAEEAFRWALANADVAELVSPQDIRDRLARISNPMYQTYTQTLSDKVRENIDYVLKERTFKISYKVDEETARATHMMLDKIGQLGVVDNLGIAEVFGGEELYEVGDYFGDFINAKSLITCAPNLKNPLWASRLVNIEELNLLKLQIDDPSWMKNMKQLRHLILVECSITDLSVLSEHENIWHINLSGSQIKDISFIDKFQKLEMLNITHCPIEDYSPLLTTKSRIKILEIDEDALEQIGEENLRKRHIGIEIRPKKSTPFWWLLD